LINAHGHKRKYKNNNLTNVEYKDGCVYSNFGNLHNNHVPEQLKLDRIFGFFVGTYLSNGYVNKNHIFISNCDYNCNDNLVKFCKRHSLQYHYNDRNCSNTIHGKILCIRSYTLSQLFIKAFGKTAELKRIPAELFNANINFLKGLIDGYFCNDGIVSKYNYISMVGISKNLLLDIQTILSKFNIFSNIKSSKYTNKYNIKRKYKDHDFYTLLLSVADSIIFKDNFYLTTKTKQIRLEKYIKNKLNSYNKSDVIPDIKTKEFGLITVKRNLLHKYIEKCNYDEDKIIFKNILKENIKYDKIISIKEYESEHDYVYDLTCDKTKNFALANALVMRDTFHLAGVASKGNITLGVPRLKELLTLQKKLKNPQNVIYLKDDYKHNIDKATIIMNNIAETRINDIIVNDPVFYLNPNKSSNNNNNILEEDKTFMKFYDVFNEVMETDKTVFDNNPWVIRLEFDRKKMLYKNICMSDINLVLMNKYPNAVTMYSDDNSGKLIFRLNLSFDSNLSIEDDYNNLKNIAENIKDTIVKGVSNIKNAFINDEESNKYGNIVISGRDVSGNTAIGEVYEAKHEVFITTEGTNLIDIMMMDHIDTTRCYSIDPLEMYAIFGIEVGNIIIQQQFKSIMTDNKTNIHHIGLLVDKMCHNGYYMSIDRFGINKENIGPLAKASFEETALILKNAAVFGEVDNLKGVSSTIIVGQISKCGTGIVKLFLDEEFMINKLNEIGFDKDETIEEDYENEIQDICVDDGEQINMAYIKSDGISLETMPQIDIDF
jgi:DNA-directed RNA polymerase beta' subunit